MTGTLEDLLDATRDALLAGDLTALSGLEGRVASAAAELSSLGEDRARRLLEKADRNARLLQAAARGLRAARDTVNDIVSGPRLATYDAQGRKASLSGPERALLRL